MSYATSPAHTVFVVLTIISSVFVRLSPFPDFYRIYKRKDTGEVAVLPVVLLGMNCCLLTIYGYLVNNIFPLFFVAVLGVVTSSVFIGIFYKFTPDRASVRRVCAANLLIVILVVVYTLVASTSVTHQSRHGVNPTVGWATIAGSIAMFGSPLTTVKKVVQTKSAASLPFTMCVTYAVNCLLWVVLCLLAPDKFVMIPNAAGAALGIVQVILCFIYRPKKSHSVQAVSADVGDLEIQPQSQNHHKLGSDFVAFHSPTI
ncbi:hypothetical protein PHYSODRAFT_323998 [Phytophthora sojae]|uniref:Sugar transporter SWEET1 n=1 Tax=Phytophthora sojae (strain P6497) TaxID=1094619 RepID=G4YNV3_PHYSP|nr:hypothetical protein PHYSODRAFT_323998 [Phytophthora sojae]EGZ30661.1 hypothetical protein PHYSODRAFT_323998 [Phytophthora sojae]|eukprot:XP_009517936.1 hypothetical protein PHYSODRAFT_323998 [Phytophthora sojae]